LIKLEIISSFEETSVKSLMEKAVPFYVEYMEEELLKHYLKKRKQI
jgi:hypothetical protein